MEAAVPRRLATPEEHERAIAQADARQPLVVPISRESAVASCRMSQMGAIAAARAAGVFCAHRAVAPAQGGGGGGGEGQPRERPLSSEARDVIERIVRVISPASADKSAWDHVSEAMHTFGNGQDKHVPVCWTDAAESETILTNGAIFLARAADMSVSDVAEEHRTFAAKVIRSCPSTRAALDICDIVNTAPHFTALAAASLMRSVLSHRPGSSAERLCHSGIVRDARECGNPLLARYLCKFGQGAVATATVSMFYGLVAVACNPLQSASASQLQRLMRRIRATLDAEAVASGRQPRSLRTAPFVTEFESWFALAVPNYRKAAALGLADPLCMMSKMMADWTRILTVHALSWICWAPDEGFRRHMDEVKCYARFYAVRAVSDAFGAALALFQQLPGMVASGISVDVGLAQAVAPFLQRRNNGGGGGGEMVWTDEILFNVTRAVQPTLVHGNSWMRIGFGSIRDRLLGRQPVPPPPRFGVSSLAPPPAPDDVVVPAVPSPRHPPPPPPPPPHLAEGNCGPLLPTAATAEKHGRDEDGRVHAEALLATANKSYVDAAAAMADDMLATPRPPSHGEEEDDDRSPGDCLIQLPPPPPPPPSPRPVCSPCAYRLAENDNNQQQEEAVAAIPVAVKKRPRAEKEEEEDRNDTSFRALHVSYHDLSGASIGWDIGCARGGIFDSIGRAQADEAPCKGEEGDGELDPLLMLEAMSKRIRLDYERRRLESAGAADTDD